MSKAEQIKIDALAEKMAMAAQKKGADYSESLAFFKSKLYSGFSEFITK